MYPFNKIKNFIAYASMLLNYNVIQNLSDPK